MYTVKRGDSLSKIAQEQLGDASRWPEIAQINAISNPDLIHPGQQLRLPVLPKGGLLGVVKRALGW